MDFKLQAPFQPMGDQPQAIEKLIQGIQNGEQHQVLLGATGTGKTYTIANIIERTQLPALVMVHNKTLAAQLYAEFRSFFPENAVEFFVSYYALSLLPGILSPLTLQFTELLSYFFDLPVHACFLFFPGMPFIIHHQFKRI